MSIVTVQVIGKVTGIAHAYHTCHVDEDDEVHDRIEATPLVVGVLQAEEARVVIVVEEARVGVNDEQAQCWIDDAGAIVPLR